MVKFQSKLIFQTLVANKVETFWTGIHTANIDLKDWYIQTLIDAGLLVILEEPKAPKTPKPAEPPKPVEPPKPEGEGEGSQGTEGK